MGSRGTNQLKRFRAVGFAGLAIVAGVLVPLLTAGIARSLQSRFDFPYLFLYFPGVLFLSYAGGLLAGMTGAVVSVILAYFSTFQAGPLTALGLARHGLPLSLFLFTGTVIVIAGDQYRANKEQLRDQLREVSRRARITGLVARVTSVLSSGADQQKTSDAVCKGCAETIGDACAIVLSRPPTRTLHLEGFHAVWERDRAESRRGIERALLRGGGEFSRQMLDETDIATITAGESGQGSAAATLVEQLAGEGVQRAAFAPLRTNEDALGYLVVMSAARRSWEPDELELIRSVAERLTGAVARSRRIEQRIRRERNTRLLAEAMIDFFKEQTVAELVQRVTRSCVDALGEWCSVSLLDSESSTLRLVSLHHADGTRAPEIAAAYEQTRLSSSDPLVKGILESPIAIILTPDDPATAELARTVPSLDAVLHGPEPRQVLVTRIVIGGQSLGVLTLAGRSGRQWEDEDVTLAAGIADRAGAALANLRLIESERRARRDAEREARLMEAISRTIAIAAGSLDSKTVFGKFAEALGLLLPFERVSVTLPATDRDWLTVPYFSAAASTTPPDLFEGPRTGTARGRVLDTGKTFIRSDTLRHQEFEEDRVFAGGGTRSYLIVPMHVGEETIGTLSFGHREPDAYTDSHVKVVQTVADHLAITISRSLLFEQMQRRAGELSEMLQRALLPVDLPNPPFVTLGALYQSADPAARIGGDWYDAFMLPDGRVLVSIGDVTGRGLPAATTMAQVRHIVRAYALERRAPGETMTAVNEFVMHAPERWHLSVWLGILDPYTGELVYSNAGHPPPLVVRDQRTSYLNNQGPLLGFASRIQYSEARLDLAPGTRLLLYTDGLTEASRDVVDSERRLAEETLETLGAPPHRAVHALADQMLRGTNPQDDIALLVVDIQPAAAPLRLSLPALPENLWRVRRAIAAFARRHEILAHVADAMVVAVGEAALNVVEHAYRGGQGRLVVRAERRDASVVVNVRDFGHWQEPVERGRGRGTRIMQGFSARMTSTTGPAGTSVELAWDLSAPGPSPY